MDSYGTCIGTNKGLTFFIDRLAVLLLLPGLNSNFSIIFCVAFTSSDQVCAFVKCQLSVKSALSLD